MDMQTDPQGNPYLLYFKNSCVVVALLSDGQCQEVLTHPIEISGGYIGKQSDPIFMGNIDGAMHWIYGSKYKHVVYTPATNSFDIIDFKEDIEGRNGSPQRLRGGEAAADTRMGGKVLRGARSGYNG